MPQMTTGPSATTAPSVEVVLGEVVMNLAMLAHAYLEPASAEGGAPPEPDLAAADIAIDVAGKAFERMQSRLEPSERSAMARLLTELRLTYVRKRGL
jgi:hypothetical protein